MTGILFIGLLSSLLLGASEILAKKLFNKVDVKTLLTYNFIFSGLIALSLSPLYLSFQNVRIFYLLMLIIVIIDVVAEYCYFSAMNEDEISTVSPLIAAAPLFTLIFSALFITGAVNIKIIIGVLIIMMAIYLIRSNGIYLNKIKKKVGFLILTAAGLFGANAILIKSVLDEEYTNFASLYLIRTILIAVVFVFLFRQSIKKPENKTLLSIFFRSLIVGTGVALSYYVLGRANVNYAVAITHTYPLFVFILAAIFLKEKITKHKIIGALLVIIGIVVLNF